jgi:hypothetical protein
MACSVDGEPHPTAHQLHCYRTRRGVLGEHLTGIEGELHDTQHIVGHKNA